MYRKMTATQIAQTITIYHTPIDHKIKVDTDVLNDIIKDSSVDNLYGILTNKLISKKTKETVLQLMSTNVNFSSIEPLINGSDIDYMAKLALKTIIKDMDRTILYTLEEALAIVRYNTNKSRISSSYSQKQANDLREQFANKGISDYIISLGGAQDYKFSDSKNEVGADFVIYPNTDDEIVGFLRYGTSSGGSQNDRHRGMIKIAEKYNDKRFLFINDGPEAYLSHHIYTEVVMPNALCSTIKLIDIIDFKKFTFE